MNNILLFSHKSDIDGMGEVILSKLAFENIDYILCTNVYTLNKRIQEEYNKGNLYKYEKIYITDLSLKKEMANTLFNDKELNNKIYIFDHHETAIEEGLLKYPNCNIQIKDKKTTYCATQIFYNYLIKEKYLKYNQMLEEFIELVRREDTYDWKKLGDIKAHDLAILYNSIGPEKYIQRIYNKLLSSYNNKDIIKNIENHFEFTAEEKEIINNKKADIKEKIEKYTKYLKQETIENIKVEICFIEYEYRNDIADYLIENNKNNCDIVMMIAMDNDQISLRSLKENNYPRIIAEEYGGGGHDRAAAIPITDQIKEKIIESILHN